MSTNSAPFKYSQFALFILAAGIVNTIIYFVAQAFGAAMKVDTPAYSDISAVVVAGATIVPMLIAGFVTWLIARKYRGFLTFAKWAGLVFAMLSIASLFPTAVDAGTLISLALTHVVAGALWFLGVSRAAGS